MKIVQLLGTATYAASGPTYHCTRLCAEMAHRGEDVWLLSQEGRPLPGNQGFTHLTYPRSRRYGPLWGSPEMESAIAGMGSDILHNNGIWILQGLYAARARSRGQCRLLVTSPHGSLSSWAMNHHRARKALFWRLWQRRVLAQSDMLHATAEHELADIRRHGFRQPVAVIPLGIDLPPPAPKDQPASADGQRRLLFLARLHPVKGLVNLLDAWNIIASRHPGWTLVIAGPLGKESEFDLPTEIARRNLPRVETPGALYDAAKSAAYHAAELYVLPTFTENFGLTIAEALAHGTPVITTRGAPWRSLEQHGAGWWIDIGLAPLIASLDHALALSAGELHDMGQRGKRLVEDEFSWDSIAERMIAAYHHILHGSPRPGCVHID